MNFKTRKILALISGCLVHTTFGAMYTLGTVTPYIASYLFYQGNKDIKVVDIGILYPMMIILQNIGIILSMVKLQKILSMKMLCFIGTTGFALTVLASSFMKSFMGYCIFYGAFYGFFVGIAYLMPFKNCYSYFPNRKGMCAGVCMMGYGFGSLIYNQIFLHIVNPNNVPANKDHLFPEEVANNFPTALIVLSIIFFSLGLIATLLFIPIKKEELKQNPLLNSQVTNSQQNQDNLVEPQNPTVSQAFKFLKQNPNKKKQMRKMVPLIMTSSVFGCFLAYNYKQYGETIINNDSLLTLAGSLGCITNSLGRICWNIGFDYLSFRTIMTILNTSLLICCISFYYHTNGVIYVILVVFTYLSYGAFYGLMPTQVFRIVGEKYGPLIYPFVYFGFTMASNSQFLFHQLVVRKNGDNGFKIGFIIYGTIQLISILLVRVFKFEYIESEKQRLQNH